MIAGFMSEDIIGKLQKIRICRNHTDFAGLKPCIQGDHFFKLSTVIKAGHRILFRQIGQNIFFLLMEKFLAFQGTDYGFQVPVSITQLRELLHYKRNCT